LIAEELADLLAQIRASAEEVEQLKRRVQKEEGSGKGLGVLNCYGEEHDPSKSS